MISLLRSEEIWALSENSWLSVTIDRCSTDTQMPVLILCHGLTGDKIGPQKLLSDLSRHLAMCCKREVIRFDFRGSGLSSGSFNDTSLKSMCEDALWIANHRNAPILWLGISTGALVALMAAGKRGKKERVIAISNGFLESIDFSDVEEDFVSLRGGQLFLSKKYFSERLLLRPRANYFPKVGTITSVLGSEDRKHFKECESLQTAKVIVHTIEGGDHLFTKPEKRKELFAYLEGIIYGAP